MCWQISRRDMADLLLVSDEMGKIQVQGGYNKRSRNLENKEGQI